MSEQPRALILVADEPESAEVIKHALSPAHDLVLVHSLTAATRLIANVDFDGIVAGVHFDDSRMMDLLRAVRSEPRFTNKPFVAIRLMPTVMSKDMESSSSQMATVLGASGYISIDQFPKEADRVEELRKRLLPLLGGVQ